MNAGLVAIRSAQIVLAHDPDNCEEQIDGSAHLRFTVVNTDGIRAETLLDVRTEAAGAVRIEAEDGALRMEPGSAISAGQPIEQLERSKAPDQPIEVILEDPIDSLRPGLTADVTFVFEHSGSPSLAVPLLSC